MNNIEALLSELGRASMRPENCSYNGITEMQSSITYQKMVEELYSNAISDLYDLDESKRGITIRRIGEVRECQECFDIPTKETVDALLSDYNAQPDGKRNKSLLDDYRYCTFVLECVSIQKDYLERFASFVTVENRQETNIDTIPETPKMVEETIDKDWLTVDEVVKKFGLPKNNIKSRKWRIENDFPYKGYDENKGAYNKVLFKSEHVEKWLENHK